MILSRVQIFWNDVKYSVKFTINRYLSKKRAKTDKFPLDTENQATAPKT